MTFVGSRCNRAWLAPLAWLSLAAAPASADPWLAPGDPGIRDDLQRLADAGIVHGPVTTWPISWPDIARDVGAVSAEAVADRGTLDALLRIQHLARRAAVRGVKTTLEARGAHEPIELRGFTDTPREPGEVRAGAGWLGRRFAANLSAAVIADPSDGKTFRADGSYLGVSVGNVTISAGYLDRWWGPGWEGGLILSTNARPMPTVTLERNYTDPFDVPVLRWLGPWRASLAVGEAESGGVALARVRFLAARVNIKPRPWLEMSLTRTAQWCGDGRSCDWSTFTDLLVGRDNREAGQDPATEPGNQMAGYDVRLRSPWRRLPLAIYSQWIGEDEAGGLPSKFIGQFGLEGWAYTPIGNLRLHVEYADTACSFLRSDPELNCAYRNGIFAQGYSYRGRVIGHSMDNDSRLLSAGVNLTRERGDVLTLTARRYDLNRDGGPHALSDTPQAVNNVEFRYSRALVFGRLVVGAAYDRGASTGGIRSGPRAYVSWQQGN